VIIFGSVRFLSKQIMKPKFCFFKKTKTSSHRLVSVQFFRTKTSSNRFGLVFLVWLGFFGFGSVWLGFFGLGSVRFGLVFSVLGL